MPWKGEKSPYRIWLSEVILQQTQVSRGIIYYNRFLERFPTVRDLAEAHIDEVIKYWEGLGYYSRARNLHHTAGVIFNSYGGIFPADYKELLKLKGIGPYTAAAIASFAYGIPEAAVDGNVYRVLSRYFSIQEPIDSTSGKKRFKDLANACLEPTDPGRYNQAIIDFGAIQCKPGNPDCRNCALQSGCQAFTAEIVSRLPVKAKKMVKTTRFLNFIVLNHQGKLLVRRREERDIWQHLYEFPLVETPTSSSWEAIHHEACQKGWWNQNGAELVRRAGPYKQTLTHQQIRAEFWIVEVSTLSDVLDSSYQKIQVENIDEIAFPGIIHCFFEDKTLHLNLF